MVEEIKLLLPLLTSVSSGVLWLIAAMMVKNLLIWGMIVGATVYCVRIIFLKMWLNQRSEWIIRQVWEKMNSVGYKGRYMEDDDLDKITALLREKDLI